MAMECNSADSADKVWQTLDQKTESEVNSEETKEEKAIQISLEESGHYWFCPFFVHQPYCQYVHFDQFSGGFCPTDPSVNSWTQKVIKDNTPSKRRSTQSGSAAKSGQQLERLYSCRLCDQLNGTKDYMSFRKHIENHLGKERPFVCRVCGKEFKFRSNCRNHLIAHSIVRKYLPPTLHRESQPESH